MFSGACSAVLPVTQEIVDEIAAGGATESILNQLNALMGQTISVGLLDVLYLGVKLGVYPCLIFMGVGAMTDFGPLIANPKSLLLGAAAQLGIFVTFMGAGLSGLSPAQRGCLHRHHRRRRRPHRYLTSPASWLPDLLGPIAVAAYSYMALVPVIQPPIMKAAHHQGRASDRDEAAAACFQD